MDGSEIYELFVRLQSTIPFAKNLDLACHKFKLAQIFYCRSPIENEEPSVLEINEACKQFLEHYTDELYSSVLTIREHFGDKPMGNLEAFNSLLEYAKIIWNASQSDKRENGYDRTAECAREVLVRNFTMPIQGLVKRLEENDDIQFHIREQEFDHIRRSKMNAIANPIHSAEPIDTSDLITTQELANLARVSLSTFNNRLSESRNSKGIGAKPPFPKIPGSGQQPARYSYSEIRPWLLHAWKKKAAYFPEKYAEVKDALAAL